MMNATFLFGNVAFGISRYFVLRGILFECALTEIRRYPSILNICHKKPQNITKCQKES